MRASLAGASRFLSRKSVKQLHEYFFSGSLPDVSSTEIEILSFHDVFKRWLHPDPESLGPWKTTGKVSSIRQRFQVILTELGRNARQGNGSEYGAMGGKEQLIMLSFNPGMDFRNEIDFGGRKPWPECYAPFDIFHCCVSSTRRELHSAALEPEFAQDPSSAAYVPYGAGLVLWDHLSFVLDNYPRFIHSSSPSLCELPWTELKEHPRTSYSIQTSGDQLDHVLLSLRTFFDRDPDDESRRRHTTVEFATRMTERFEAREFGDALMTRWDHAQETAAAIASGSTRPPALPPIGYGDGS